MVLVATTGLRIGGLDALAGKDWPPGHYLRAATSPRSLYPALVVAGVAIVLFAALDRWVDPQVQEWEVEVESWLGVELDRSSQLVFLVVALVILTPLAAAVAEVLSAVSRHETAIQLRLEHFEQRRAREDLAHDLHDSEILSTLGQLRREATAAPDRRRLMALEMRLCSLQLERQIVRQPRTVRACCRRATHGANLLGLDLRLDCDVATLDREVPGEIGNLVERLAMVQVSNSADAGASLAGLALSHRRGELQVTYSDNGSGFDPRVVEQTQGGLWRLQADLQELGGSLCFTREAARRTRSTATLRFEEPE
jgi:hypothetical protein